ncbi:RDD family protein [Nocardia gamkensis]|uniref:RDD family protein n=1 Tax=Nocardia gamkensis TaxID=352869 RepID=A0A7X6R791_9NOCA|nr:RDD family protein [Nocardia gamkensis]NKY31435.1 RDD family protein [Nocardia gamkensis]NQE72608.1 hypothetical protein [Nocardia gamkensis]
MTYDPAPFPRRLLARILDLVFCLVLTFAVAVPVGAVVVPLNIATDSTYEEILYGVGVWLCYFLAYVGLEVFLLVRRGGQTLGKGLVGLAVVPAGEWARPRLKVRQAAVRMTIIFGPFFFMSLSGANSESGVLNTIAVFGMLSVLASLLLAALPIGSRRTVHDFVTATRVVRATKRNIHWRTDLPMVLPGRVDMIKRL